MTITFRDKIILIILGFALGIYAGYQTLWVPSSARIAELEKDKQSIEGLAGDLEPLFKETERLKEAEKEAMESVNNIKKLSGGLTATKEEFLVFLGESAEVNNVTVSGFNELGTKVKDGIYRTSFDFELKGNSVDINKVLEDINNIGIKCSFGSVSYRQNEDYDYLKRFFDDLTELPWFKEKEDEPSKQEEQDESVKEESSLPEPERIPQVPLPEKQEIIEDKPAEPEPGKKPVPIEDRLNNLLEQTSHGYMLYKPVLLNSDGELPVTEYKKGQQMKLNVTVCLIMYNEPSFETSFLTKTESDSDDVL